jgi:3-hydroxyacyl-[acyl-carrier-protein] dehydratase
MTMILKNQLYQIEHSQESDGKKQFTISLLKECPIYRAHFPGQPITPGVCIVQIAQELLGQVVGHTLEISEVKNVKFLHVLSPIDNPVVDIVFTAIETSGESVSAKAEVKEATTMFTTVSFVCQPVKRSTH